MTEETPKPAYKLVPKQLIDDISKIASRLSIRAAKLQGDIRELLTYQDAHSVIVIASLLDESLERVVQTKMVPLTPKFRKRIFDGYGPLSTFSAKIDMVYAFGIVPKQMFDDLRTFNRIRNCFAHATKNTNLQDPEIVEMLRAISGMDGAIPEMKARLLERLLEIGDHLDGIAGQPPANPDGLQPTT